jgi:DNA-binding CsgD family transcriptional regulator
MNQHGAVGLSLVTLARIEAARGQRDLVEEHVVRCREEIGPFGIGCLIVYEAAVLGLDALSCGDHAVARDHLEIAWDHATAFRLGNALVVPFVADLVEARMRCGDRVGAVKPMEWLRARALTGSTYAAAAAERCCGLLADDAEDSLRAFAAARALLEYGAMPFELARTLLNEGEVLRRVRRVKAARQSLRGAKRIFEGLGAQPWAEQATRELAAAGVDQRRSGEFTSGGPEQLTARELQVARMVACGRNNVETGTALFMSRKTVEAHLTRIYRKLQIRSRTELAALLVAGLPGTG